MSPAREHVPQGLVERAAWPGRVGPFGGQQRVDVGLKYLGERAVVRGARPLHRFGQGGAEGPDVRGARLGPLSLRRALPRAAAFGASPAGRSAAATRGQQRSVELP